MPIRGKGCAAILSEKRLTSARTAAGLVLIFTTSMCAFAQEDVVVRGLVVDAAGKPAAGIEIATTWDFAAENATSLSEEAKTDAAGQYKLTVPGWMSEAAIFVLDGQRKHGGIATIKPQESTKVPTITLAPAVRVFGHFESKELGRPLTWTNVYITTAQRARLIQNMSDEAKFGFLLPPGKYQFHGYGRDVQGVKREIEVPAGAGARPGRDRPGRDGDRQACRQGRRRGSSKTPAD